MELYIYETPEGNVADFRPYLDGLTMPSPIIGSCSLPIDASRR